jgi:hypothetical protein
MVRVILSGAKTQTRRIVKPQPSIGPQVTTRPEPREGGMWVFMAYCDRPSYQFATGDVRCPYGVVGDELWVRESWFSHSHGGACTDTVYYRATPETCGFASLGLRYEQRETGFLGPWPGPWRPSIHMPRWASRITLRITEVRIERLQEISETDAIAEGVERIDDPRGTGWKSYEIIHEGRHKGKPHPHAIAPNLSPVTSYRELWEAINGKGSWDRNEFVWVISFERIK